MTMNMNDKKFIFILNYKLNYRVMIYTLNLIKIIQQMREMKSRILILSLEI